MSPYLHTIKYRNLLLSVYRLYRLHTREINFLCVLTETISPFSLLLGFLLFFLCVRQVSLYSVAEDVIDTA